MSRVMPAPYDDLIMPDGWYLYWCGGCGYSVSFTEDDAVTYGDDWWDVLLAACDHDCSALAAARRHDPRDTT